MKSKILVVLLLSLAASLAWSAKSKARYPHIESVSSPAFDIQDRITIANRQAERAEVEKPLKVKAVLKDKAFLRIGEKGDLRIALNKKAVLNITEKSEVEIPAIEWENGRINEIRLHRGAIRLLCEEKCEQKIITPLFEGVAIQGDFILKYDPAIPEVELTVVKGEMPFRGLENELSVAVMAGQKISFRGLLENGEPAFDILLKGRKVAKGKMSDATEVPPIQLLELHKQEEKKKKIVKAPLKTKRLASQICDRPWGELNQCAWSCEKNKKKAKECVVSEGAICVRTRCNANGEWSDRMELTGQGSACRSQTFVSACDY
ncbi:MAG: hypothetical protein ACXWC9_01660 [Pseudobdellovibrionaceae bacterium]